MKDIKILQLGKAYPPVNFGGVELVIQFFTEGLAKRGIQCDALGVNDKYQYEVQVNSDKSTVFREKLVIKKFSTLLSVHLIFRLFRIAKNYDIIHIHHPDPMSALALFIVRPKAKIVLHWHSDIVKQKATYLFYKPIEKWLVSRADRILCTTPKYLKESPVLKAEQKKGDFIPIGIDKKHADQFLVEKLRNENRGKFVVVAIGRLIYYKGFSFLVEAMSYLDDRFVLYIIGEGKDQSVLDELIRKHNLQGRVHLLGFQSDEVKYAYLTAGDVFVLPSIFKSEAYGIVQVEAMSFAKPVVSTEIEGSGVDWVNEDGVSGFTVPMMDGKAIAERLNILGSNPDLYASLAAGAAKRYEEMFTSEIMIDKLVEQYELVLASGSVKL